MKNYILNLIYNNMGDIILGVILITILSIVIYKKFKNLTKGQKKAILLKSLLEMVIIAEGKLGSKTGIDKKSMVYSMFKAKFPLLSIVISESLFDSLLDEALDEMKKVLEKEILELDPDGNVTNLSKLLSIDTTNIDNKQSNNLVENSTNDVSNINKVEKPVASIATK